MAKDQLVFYLNGKRVELGDAEPELTLIQFVRSVGLTGTKLGCAEGGCGACTVMISHYDASQRKVIHRSANGCLLPLCAVEGMAVTTVEGLGNTKDGLNPVQERVAHSHGSQCGFCTPGIVMALYTFLRNNPRATAKEIEEALDGNLCRCTGYRPILDAAKSFASDVDVPSYRECHAVITGGERPASGAGVCPTTGKPCDCKQGGGERKGPVRQGMPTDPSMLTSHLIFPPALKRHPVKTVRFEGERVTWIRPTSLQELVTLKKAHPKAKLVVGNTEVGIETKFKGQLYPVVIAPTHVPELNILNVSAHGVEIGASVTLQRLQEELPRIIASLPEWKGRSLSAMLRQLRWFAGHQIRSVACIGGNICTASPISDLNPVLIAAGAKLNMASTSGGRVVPIREFFIKYRTVNMEDGEVLRSVEVPFTQELEFFHSYKQARRRDDDIAIVTAGIRVRLSKQGDDFRVEEAGLGYGGMAPKTVFCPQTEQGLVGQVWDEQLLKQACLSLEKDLPLAPNAPGGMIQFRRTLTTSFFYKFYLRVLHALKPAAVPARYLSAIEEFDRDLSHGTQQYQTNGTLEPVTFPVMHTSAEKQVTGEAQYTDDVPHPVGGLYGALVFSTVSHGRILSVDPSAALAMPGVVRYVDAKDVEGHNLAAPDEELFATQEVFTMSQPIGAIIAYTHERAVEASKAVKVEYEELPHVITIEEAIEQESFFSEFDSGITYGDVDLGFLQSDHVVEGSLKVGGQEHFYLEPHTSLALPSEDREMKIISSTQNPTHTQDVVAEVLGVDFNRVTVTVKRMGGGFGGKETRSIFLSAATAVCARAVGGPVRITLDRDMDFAATGHRHPFLGIYKVGFKNDGTLLAVDVRLYNNAGWSLDLSGPVMERAIFHIENSYKVPNLRVRGRLCKTNIQSNTAFRGFGGPQSMLICEAYMEHVARALGVETAVVQERNLYNAGDHTHYLQVLPDCHIRRMWAQVQESAAVARRMQEVTAFNAAHRWKKRGIATVPVKFGMSFTAKFLNQAAALVLVYKDGSCLVSHGGTEMGQGLHTKMQQVAARALGIPIEKVYIKDTSTDKVANTSPTAASVSSDLNGMAVLRACEEIMTRLEPLRNAHPDKSFAEITSMAYFQKIDLCAKGFFEGPNVGYDFKTQSGTPFNYFCWGVATTEVEIDVLTGDFHVRRADIIMDVGDSLNPAIDIGQVEGAYVQGLGWCTMEELVYFPNGYLFTRGPGAYKIPSFNDIPVDFRVSLLTEAANPRAVHSSKGVGEPPFFLAGSAFFAIKEAIRSARVDAGYGGGYFYMASPATSERIRVACVDQFTTQFEGPAGKL